MRFENLSFLPPLNETQVAAQIGDILKKELLPIIEYAEEPNNNDIYWSTWPLDAEELDINHIMAELKNCSRNNLYYSIRLSGYNKTTKCYENSFIYSSPNE